jgi:selenocysteine lyase/cysteine desulfurase
VADVTRAGEGSEVRRVCVSALTWTHGTRLPVADIVDAAHDAGAQVLVDAVQMPGQMPVDVGSWGADFVVGAGHKWLLAPFGSGFLHVAPDAEVAPAQVGYRSVGDPEDTPPAFYEGARRFEVATASPAPYAGLVEAVETMRAVGLDAVERRIAHLTDRLKAGLGADRLVSPPDSRSGLVSFEAEDPDALVSRLADEGVVVRSLPTGAVRASVHAFNTEADVDALLAHT